MRKVILILMALRPFQHVLMSRPMILSKPIEVIHRREKEQRIFCGHLYIDDNLLTPMFPLKSLRAQCDSRTSGSSNGIMEAMRYVLPANTTSKVNSLSSTK